VGRQRAFQLFGCALAMTLASAVALARGTRPNVVFILADNVGCGDTGPRIAGNATPRVDQLAREGLLCVPKPKP
jgi:arylsulfatase